MTAVFRLSLVFLTIIASSGIAVADESLYSYILRPDQIDQFEVRVYEGEAFEAYHVTDMELIVGSKDSSGYSIFNEPNVNRSDPDLATQVRNWNAYISLDIVANGIIYRTGKAYCSVWIDDKMECRPEGSIRGVLTLRRVTYNGFSSYALWIVTLDAEQLVSGSDSHNGILLHGHPSSLPNVTLEAVDGGSASISFSLGLY